MKKVFILLALILTSFSIQAQDAFIGNWLSYLGTYKVAEKWNVQFNSQARFHNLMGDVDQVLLRVGTNYNLDKIGNYSIGAGVDYFYNSKYIGNTDQKNNFNEFRIYEQLITKHNFKRFYFQHRYRLENRFFEDQDVKFRFRYFLQVKMALNKKRITDKTFYLAIINEAFWNLRSFNHFDRHWLQYTLGYKLNKNWSFEVGNQTQFTGQGNYNSRLQFWAFHNMDWRKKRVLQRAAGRL